MIHRGLYRGRAAARLAVAVVLSLAAALAIAGPASAHALLKAAAPAPGSTVGASPPAIRLTFSELPDPRLSSIRVLDASGASRVTGSPSAVAGKPLEIELTLPNLPDGVYTVSWRTVSAVDGHAAAGSFAFGVGVAAPSPGASAAAESGSSVSGSPPTIVARWLLYAGLVLLLGVGFVALAIETGPSKRLVRLAGWSWLLFMLGTLDVVGFQWLEAEVDISSVLATSIGMAGLIRVAVALAAGGVLLVAIRGGRAERPGIVGLGVLAALGMAVDVANGHAAAATAPIVSTLLQWTHVAAVGVWMGGLAALLAVIAGRPREEQATRAKRFSTWAGVALAIVAISGVVRAITEIGSLDALVTTDYGRVVVAKSVLLGVLAILGAGNRWFGVPRLLRGGGSLHWIGGAELVTSLVVLALSALLVNLVPPVSAGGVATPAPQPVIAVGHDFGTSVKARLVVSPGVAGFNTFELRLSDFDSGAAVAASAVTLRFEAASNPALAPSTLALSAGSASGSFGGSGGNLSPDGIWRVTATVTSGAGAVEVPFVLATRTAALPSDVNAAPGVPPITTIHLPDGRSVQLYLDPSAAGKNDVHATFFDAQGTELPLPSTTMALIDPAGEGALLSPRLLEPGHFVASTTVAAGSVGLDVVAPDPAGSAIHVHATIEVTP